MNVLALGTSFSIPFLYSETKVFSASGNLLLFENSFLSSITNILKPKDLAIGAIACDICPPPTKTKLG